MSLSAFSDEAIWSSAQPSSFVGSPSADVDRVRARGSDGTSTRRSISRAGSNARADPRRTRAWLPSGTWNPCIRGGVRARRARSPGCTDSPRYFFSNSTVSVTVVVFIPVLTAIVLKHWPDAKRALRLGLLSAVIFSLVFLATTPGMVLDGARFVHDVHTQLSTYQHVADFRFSVQPVWEHGAKIAWYLTFQSFSHYPIVSAVIACCCAVGMAVLARRQRRKGKRHSALVALYLDDEIAELMRAIE